MENVLCAPIQMSYSLIGRHHVVQRDRVSLTWNDHRDRHGTGAVTEIGTDTEIRTDGGSDADTNFSVTFSAGNAKQISEDIYWRRYTFTIWHAYGSPTHTTRTEIHPHPGAKSRRKTEYKGKHKPSGNCCK